MFFLHGISQECWKQNQLEFGVQRSPKLQYFWHCLFHLHSCWPSLFTLGVKNTDLGSGWRVATTKHGKFAKMSSFWSPVIILKIHGAPLEFTNNIWLHTNLQDLIVYPRECLKIVSQKPTKFEFCFLESWRIDPSIDFTAWQDKNIRID